MSKFYITTSIPYLNSVPHVGFAMELAQADFLARYHRLHGEDVYFLTGTDEHGIKIAQKAEEEGITPQQLVDKNAAFFRDLANRLEATNDDFIRTTEDRHKVFAREMWKKLDAAGDIYRSKYSGLYCVGCEKFLSAKDLIDGVCAIHLKPPVKVEEENYFFKLSRYQDVIRKKIESDELLIVPEYRKQEILNFMKDGLDDVSFSRPRESVKWGIEVPGDPSQLMYVWCDALTNYLSVIDQKRYWPADIHVIGKDIIRFHALYWIGMLLSAGYELPKVIMVHGFVNSEGQKMSKSLGNVKDPFVFIDKYGADALRYYLLREVPTLDDGDFSQERFDIVYKDELANTYGNLVSRVVAMTGKYFGGKVPAKGEDAGFKKLVGSVWHKFDQGIGEFNLKKSLEAVQELGFAANKYVEDSKPWELAPAAAGPTVKTDLKKLGEVLYNLLELVRILGLMLEPAIPIAAKRISEIFGAGSELKYSEARNFGALKEGEEISGAGILFPRIEEKK